MAFTMHSHSGQFCPGHAKDQLEEVVKHAISLGYKTMGLTEHMPRTSREDLYPEEVCITAFVNVSASVFLPHPPPLANVQPAVHKPRVPDAQTMR